MSKSKVEKEVALGLDTNTKIRVPKNPKRLQHKSVIFPKAVGFLFMVLDHYKTSLP